MVRTLSIILLGGLLLIGAGCSTVKQINTDVLEPAGVAFPENVFSVGYLVQEPELIINSRANRRPDINARQQFWTGLMDVAVNSPRFNTRSLRLINHNEDSLSADTPDWNEVERLTDSLDLDALALIHHFSLEDSLKRELIFDYTTTTYYYIYEVNATVWWRIYEPQSKSVISDSTYREEYIWEAASEDKREAVYQLVDLDRAYRLSAYWSGYDIGQMLFPYWKQTERFYYIRGNKTFRRAREYVKNEQWEKAIEEWKKNFTGANQESARRAAHNIAFACEMLGKIDLAIQWAERAQNIRYDKKEAEYLDLLHERKEKLKRVDQQMPL
jgi:hypothetical protein